MTSVAVAPSRAVLYWRACRPLYVPTSVLPAAAGALVAIGQPGVHWWLLPIALLALALIHGATNVVNDVEDFARGVDTPDKMDNSRVFNTGLLSAREGRILGPALLAAATGLGVVLALVSGPAVLLYGVLGVLGGYFYTGGPRPYKYLGISDPLIVLLLGPLVTQGAYSAVTGEWFTPAAFWLGLTPGLLVTAVVQGNNLSDIPGDRAAGVRTLAVRLGFTGARRLYLTTLTLSFLCVPVLLLSGLFGWPILLVLATVPLAWRRVAQALSAEGESDPVLNTLAPLTAQLHLLTGLILIGAVVIDRSL